MSQDSAKEGLTMWTIYDHPTDYPDSFVARKWIVDKAPYPTDSVLVSETLEDLRAQLPAGMFKLPRQGGDDPNVVETWM